MISLSNLCFSQQEDNPMPAQQKNPIVLLKTNLGDIKIELFQEKAPITVKNFLEYVKKGQYNHTIFHRVIDGFMIQGGGFTTNFEQKPVGDKIKNEAENGLKNLKGTVAMARTNEVNSATAQFFINTVDNPFLDFSAPNPQQYGYCVFGKVIEGMDVIEKIAKVKTGSKGMHQNVPNENIEILEATQLPN